MLSRIGITSLKRLLGHKQPEALPAGPASILDCYFNSPPSPQNAVDIFRGEWASKFPPPLDQLDAGRIPVFQDTRLLWGINQLGGICGQSILELGPLEGAHSYMLERAGAVSVTAVEANSRAYLKCLISREILNLARTRFLCGDFVAYLESTNQRFDVIVASGVLYHMRDPLRLIQLIGTHTDRLYLWTHYFDEQIVAAKPYLQGRFEKQEPVQLGNSQVTEYRQHYLNSLHARGYSGGSGEYSTWLSREGLMLALRESGFDHFEFGYETPDHPHGPCVSLVAIRRTNAIVHNGAVPIAAPVQSPAGVHKNMAFEGYIDHSSDTNISGWIYDNRAGEEPIEVEILAGDAVIARVMADGFRADLLAACKGNGQHAFSYSASFPAGVPLSARVAGRRWLIAPSGGHRSELQLPMRFQSTLAHALEYGLPIATAQEGFSTAISVGDETENIHRLMKAYAKTIQDAPPAEARKADQWVDRENESHQEVLALLKRDDAQGLMLYLRDAHAKSLTDGITQGAHTTNELRMNADARRLVMLATLDHLTSLAEYLGVLDVECPDQHGQWGENIHSDPLVILERIRAATGVGVVTPQVIGSSFGIRTGHGIVATRDLLAFYAAHRIKTLVLTPDSKLPSGSVCEIGGGLGAAAYYANRLGIARYTIIDLPLVSLLQGYFLIRSLPEVKIALYGEEVGDAAIELLPTYAFEKRSGGCDLLFNQDSLPEMHQDYAIGYLRGAIKQQISKFLSINQEARAPQNQTQMQTVVRELVAQAGGYWRGNRSRHWLRAGYVEELYLLNNSETTSVVSSLSPHPRPARAPQSFGD